MKHIKTVNGRIVSLLPSKPRGKPFKKGEAANPGGLKRGTHFVKWRHKLSVIAAEEISREAPDELCDMVGIERGSSNGKVIIQALILQAASGDARCAEALFRFSESARIRSEAPAPVDIFVKAREALIAAMKPPEVTQ
jgi:hypothetical protein